MKRHTVEQLIGLNSFIDSQSPPDQAQNFEHNGLSVDFRVVHLPEAAKPFDFAIAAAVVGEGPNAVYEVAVNDDVPEELRGLWAWHELHDFTIIGHDTPGRCLASEQAIAEYLSGNPELMRHYLQTRIVFYENLGRFMAADIERNGQASTYDVQDVEGAKMALDFLGACLTALN